MLVQGDRTDKKDTSAFNTWKDIIIPGNVDDGMTTDGATLVHPLPLSKRKYLANYLGRAQGKAGRLKLIELSKKFPDKVYPCNFSSDWGVYLICGIYYAHTHSRFIVEFSLIVKFKIIMMFYSHWMFTVTK